MTVQDIITETRQIVQETDPNNTHANDSVITGWINACTLWILSDFKTIIKSLLTGITASEVITLDKELLSIDYASIYDGNKHYPLYTTDFNNFVKSNPGWEDITSGRPHTLVRMSNLDWKMFPSPDADWVGKIVKIYGSTYPAEVSSPIDVPPVSIALHPAYSHFCAWKFFLLLNDPIRANAEYSVFDSMRKMKTKISTSTQGSLLSLRVN